jgi:hypothetical protein
MNARFLQRHDRVSSTYITHTQGCSIFQIAFLKRQSCAILNTIHARFIDMTLNFNRILFLRDGEYTMNLNSLHTPNTRGD